MPMYLVKSLSQDNWSGRYTMYLPFSPYRFLGAKGADTLCIYQTPCAGRGTLPVRSAKTALNIKFLGGIFLGHPGPRRRVIPDKNLMQVAFVCCFRQGVAGMSRDLGRDVPDLENSMQKNCGLSFRTLIFFRIYYVYRRSYRYRLKCS